MLEAKELLIKIKIKYLMSVKIVIRWNILANDVKLIN